jgi:DNA-binding Xre family transcriptional regulator
LILQEDRGDVADLVAEKHICQKNHNILKKEKGKKIKAANMRIWDRLKA